MKLLLLSDIYATADRWHRALLWCAGKVQRVRVWAWTACTKENMRTCNDRQPARTRFC